MFSRAIKSYYQAAKEVQLEFGFSVEFGFRVEFNPREAYAIRRGGSANYLRPISAQHWEFLCFPLGPSALLGGPVDSFTRRRAAFARRLRFRSGSIGARAGRSLASQPFKPPVKNHFMGLDKA